MDTRDFQLALDRFDALAAGLDTLERRVPVVLRERLAAATAAFDAGRAAEAQELFAAVLKVAPDDAAAKTGAARARVLDAVLRETAAGARAEQAGDTQAAVAAYRRAVSLDPATRAAREGIARSGAREADAAYSTVMAQALAALARQDYGAAQRAFEQAGRLRPGAPEVADGLEQIRRATETRSLTSTLARRGVGARGALGGSPRPVPRGAEDPSLHCGPRRRASSAPSPGRSSTRSCSRSSTSRNACTTRPAATSPATCSSARAALHRRARSCCSRRLASPEMLRDAETPIRVALASDNATDVQIYRVGKLGHFEHRDLELMPGRYTVVGTRQGYRDVRRELNLLPGAAPPPLVVRCEEPI